MAAHLQIYKNKPDSTFTYTVLKGDELYGVTIVKGEKMRWQYLGKVNRTVYVVNGTLIPKPSLKTIIILQKILKPKNNESMEFISYKNWLNEENIDVYNNIIKYLNIKKIKTYHIISSSIGTEGMDVLYLSKGKSWYFITKKDTISECWLTDYFESIVKKGEINETEFISWLKKLKINTDNLEIFIGSKELSNEEKNREKEVNEYVYKDKIKYPKIELTDKEIKVFTKIDDDLNEFLIYLIHSKEHVLNNTNRIPELEQLFKINIDITCNTTLYRGIYNSDINEFKKGKEYKFNRYESFTGDVKVAKIFSKNLILVLNPPIKSIFNYGGYLEYIFSKKKSKDDYDILNLARFEKEYLLNYGLEYRVIDIKKINTFTYIYIKLI